MKSRQNYIIVAHYCLVPMYFIHEITNGKNIQTIQYKTNLSQV
jgi:hypothetical protein